MLRSLKIPDRRTLHDRSGTERLSDPDPAGLQRDRRFLRQIQAEQAAPYRDKAIVHLLGEAVYRETGVAAP